MIAFEDADGRRARVSRVGRGPALVCLHGYPENLRLFDRLSTALAPHFEVIAIDWPGLGESEPTSDELSPFALADWLVRRLDAWKLDRVHVLGHDMGGQAGLALAATHPTRVASLVVSATMAFPDLGTSVAIRLMRRRRLRELALLRSPRAVFWACERTFLPPGTRLDAATRDALYSPFARRAVRAELARMCTDYERALPALAARYPAIVAPTLVLWPEHERHFARAHADRLCRTVPHATLDVVPGAFHWMCWHAADAVASRVRAFTTR